MANEQAIEFHPEALGELEHARLWYEKQKSGLGGLFFQQTSDAISRIRESPNTWPEDSRGTRRFLIHRFPYAVVYQLRPKEILIVAVMHLKRKPGYWMRRV